jgi:hypothetical protein
METRKKKKKKRDITLKESFHIPSSGANFGLWVCAIPFSIFNIHPTITQQQTNKKNFQNFSSHTQAYHKKKKEVEPPPN